MEMLLEKLLRVEIVKYQLLPPIMARFIGYLPCYCTISA